MGSNRAEGSQNVQWTFCLRSQPARRRFHEFERNTSNKKSLYLVVKAFSYLWSHMGSNRAECEEFVRWTNLANEPAGGEAGP
ncbi:hypothetical protein BST85_11440 [Aureitalea marina]|uniref:Uncharacterized protein n=1 Tax=Aureitalea marina TaxID=930804 RepID=A0A2S7KS25_9FLAO|nr:hypothetical protein BST85_11440 [Aureitalea marina]